MAAAASHRCCPCCACWPTTRGMPQRSSRWPPAPRRGPARPLGPPSAASATTDELQRVAPWSADAQTYLCGPPSLMAAVRTIYTAGQLDDRLHSEEFTVTSAPADPADARGRCASPAAVSPQRTPVPPCLSRPNPPASHRHTAAAWESACPAPRSGACGYAGEPRHRLQANFDTGCDRKTLEPANFDTAGRVAVRGSVCCGQTPREPLLPLRASKVELYAAIRRDSRAGMSGRELQGKYNVGYRTVAAASGSAWLFAEAPAVTPEFTRWQ
ncbi:hypothetical protein ABIA39_001746 [Nocardia sp. GAS34]